MADEEIINNDLPKLLGKIFIKKGTFIHYGESSFSWAYITNDSKLIAFLKPSEGGFLEYSVIKIKDYNMSIKQNESRIFIYKKHLK